MYGEEWEDISVCAGLVATATVILLLVFIPKVMRLSKARTKSAFSIGIQGFPGIKEN